MLVKFMGNRGGGSASASLNYLLDKPEGQVEILQGNPNLSKKIAESLEFKNKYTVGVLSFEEKPDQISNAQKREIIAKFEETLFAGLSKDQYNISWIQHTDKGRLELNFFIPNVEMRTGKRLQPYYDKVDRQLVDNFKKVVNYEHNLSNPDNPEKRQAHKISLNLPKTKQERHRAIENEILSKIITEDIKDRQGVIEGLKSLNYEIVRVSEKYISVKDPNGGQNLRLKGEIYEQSFNLSKGLGESLRERNEKYGNERAESYQTARTRLNSEIERKSEYNTARYGTDGKGYQIEQSINSPDKHRREQENSRIDSKIGRKQQKNNNLTTEQKNHMVSDWENSFTMPDNDNSVGKNNIELLGDRITESTDSEKLTTHQKTNANNSNGTNETFQNNGEINNGDRDGRTFIDSIKEFGQEILGRANDFIDTVKAFGERLFGTEKELRPNADVANQIEQRTSENERTISTNEPSLQREQEIAVDKAKTKEMELTL